MPSELLNYFILYPGTYNAWGEDEQDSNADGNLRSNALFRFPYELLVHVEHIHKPDTLATEGTGLKVSQHRCHQSAEQEDAHGLKQDPEHSNDITFHRTTS